uniref:Uncharacterized protein n=1 Tax=Phenylobacterium glaciei TaxID=2803784 RepID=A0A974S8S4_9CAUL|nr:hypothetical protein JKL49_24840 [Phenylobacterium glaciei]
MRARRRNRVKRRLDAALVRLGSLGGALVIARSGLWARVGAAFRPWRPTRGARPIPPPSPPPCWTRLGIWRPIRMSPAAVWPPGPLHRPRLGGGPLAPPAFRSRLLRRPQRRRPRGHGALTLEHFVHRGAAMGRDPHPLFSIDHYVAQAPELAQSGENPWPTICAKAGGAISAPSLFQAARYRARLAGAEAQVPALVHYVTVGSALGLKPHRLFDPAWYHDQYPDVAAGGLEPLSHYVLAGGREGRNPGPWFDAARYMALRGDQLRADVDPLTDYLQGGAWTVAAPLVGRPPISG